jgi:hypothetical protein
MSYKHTAETLAEYYFRIFALRVLSAFCTTGMNQVGKQNFSDGDLRQLAGSFSAAQTEI